MSIDTKFMVWYFTFHWFNLAYLNHSPSKYYIVKNPSTYLYCVDEEVIIIRANCFTKNIVIKWVAQ